MLNVLYLKRFFRFRGLRMGIPEEIRKVPRPKNTVVVENKEEGPKHYAVRERAGINYVPGGNPQPVNGKVIGYIYEGRFVEAAERPGTNGPASRSYGSSALARRESRDILDDLMDSMDIEFAVMAYAAALLKVVKPGIKGKRMSTEYARTFVGEWYPGLNLSKNAMTLLYKQIGMDDRIRSVFAGKRLSRMAAGGHLIIDGMLKEDNSSINDLSGFTFKSRVKGIRDISIIYAYDLERREIVCSEVFPGGYIDAAAYSRFVRDNNITKGILITDKGFPPSQLDREFKERPDLHFLTPLKRNDTRIRSNAMMEFTGVLENTESKVLYKKVRIKGGRYLYSFKDPRKELQEDLAYLQRVGKGKDFDNAEHARRKEDFGTIVFLSDQDLTPEQAYSCYSDRWEIELVFRYFKSDLDIRSTDVQDDYAVIGEEFVNTISSTITCRLLRLMKEKGLLKKESFGDVMDDLSGVWRRTDAPDVLPDREDGYWVHPFEYAMDSMVALGLCSGEMYSEKVAKKAAAKASEKVKRPRGRPRKNPVEPDAPKRPRGRPRKNPPAEDKPKRPRGRPRKNAP